MNVSRTFVFSVAFYGILLTFTDFKKVEFFFGKPICFFEQPSFCTFWETLLSQSFFTATLLRWNFSGLKKIQCLFRKSQPFFLKKPIFMTMKKFIISVAFRSKIAISNDFLKCEVYSEKPSIFFSTKATFWTFWKILLIPSHSTAKLFGNFLLFWIVWVIFLKKLVLILKKATMESFEHFCYLSRFSDKTFYV